MDNSIQIGDHWASFGDGNACRIIDSKEVIKEELGRKTVRFIFLPSVEIERMYDIAEEQGVDGSIMKEYDATNVVFLERGVFRTRCWIMCGFDSGETVMTRREEHLTSVLNDTERLKRSSDGAKARLFQELETERTQVLIALRQKTDMVKEVARARGRTDSDDEEINPDNE